ncbi:MAG: hypothetical protein ACFFDC_12505 [Promethearchaeota archaeon]
MFFDKLIRKFSNQDDIVSLEDFQQRLDQLIVRLKQEYDDSKASEQDYHQKYEEKLSKLDFEGSKKAVEDSRHQLATSLELDVQLEFLMKLQSIANRIPPQSFQTPKELEKFTQIATQAFDFKKISSQYGQRMILKQFKKFLPPTVEDPTLDMTLGENGQTDEIERILQEVKNGTIDDSTIDNEIEKIIEEVRSKKRKPEDF